MTKEEFQKLVADTVYSKQGCKATELAAVKEIACAGEFDLWKDALTPLIDSGRLIEVEYILPDMNYRIKSFLFPWGTKITMDH